jgi:hypothetical protein
VEIFIARAEQGLDVGGECNIFFHSGLCRCLLQLGGPGAMVVSCPMNRGVRFCTQELCVRVEFPERAPAWRGQPSFDLSVARAGGGVNGGEQPGSGLVGLATMVGVVGPMAHRRKRKSRVPRVLGKRVMSPGLKIGRCRSGPLEDLTLSRRLPATEPS